MPDMTIIKALSIFGIKNNYTEEELKKKYHELVKLNHPDRHTDVSPEKQEEYKRKTQDINEAFELLKKNLTNGPTYTYETSSTYWSNQSYKGYGYYTTNNAEFPFEMKEIKKKISSYFVPCPAEKLKNQVSNLILDYMIKVGNSKNLILTFINFQIDLEKIYRNYIDIYSRKHKIPQFILNKKTFNYDCDCAKLFNQLKECERTVEFDFSKINRKFQYHEYFEILKPKILEEKQKIREKINYSTTNEEYFNLLKEYKKIVDKMIIEYNRKYTEFIYALEKLSNQLNKDVKKYLYDNIKEIILNSNDEEITQLLIEAIEESKQKKEAEKETSKDNNKENIKELSKIREIVYKELKEKYLISSKINIMEYEMINNLFKKAVELLYSETCTMDMISEIKKITFDNLQEEYERLIKLNAKKIIISEEFICIRNTPLIDSKLYKAIKKSYDEKNYYEIKNIYNEKKEVIDELAFQENYITIDDLLSDAIFLGYINDSNKFMQTLYYDPKTDKTLVRMIYNNSYEVLSGIPTDGNFVRDKGTDIYKNKKYLKQELLKYFNSQYQFQNNSKKNKSR